MPQTASPEAEAIQEAQSPREPSLDPSNSADWSSLREQAHRMLDDMLDYNQGIRQRAVWQPISAGLRQRFRGTLPSEPTELSQVHTEFLQHILPYGPGNAHPGFMGWAQGGGSPVGMLSEMLAAGLNANLGGRDHAPIEVEHQLTEWMRQLFGFPAGASGLCVTGTSTANLLAVKIARDRVLGQQIRREGFTSSSLRLRCYGSSRLHACVAKALDITGIGTDSLHSIATNPRGQLEPSALRKAIQTDRAAGFTPFLVIGSAGTVDTGAIDDLNAIADICEQQEIRLHVDGAFGALAILAPDLAPRLAGIERADSIAFDFHKWAQVPYDAGFLLVRDGGLQQQSFRPVDAPYLARETRGMAAGESWPCDLGIELSRSFRALKVWFTFKTYGARAIGELISQSCKLARYLEERILETPELELLAPVELNIVCFGYRSPQANEFNRMIAIDLQERGQVAPSITTLNGRVAIRAALFNHRTSHHEIDTLVEQTLLLGRALESVSLNPPKLAGSPIHRALVSRDGGGPKIPNPAAFALRTPSLPSKMI